MKLCFVLLGLLCCICDMPAYGQGGTTKVLAARTHLVYNSSHLLGGDSSTFDYKNNHQTHKTKTWYYDAGPDIWILGTQLTNYTYDINGNLLSYIEQRADGNNGWKNFNRYKYTYDTNNYRLSSALEYWNGFTWVFDYVTNWVYDANGNVLSETIQVLNERYVFSYNAQGLLDRKTREFFNNGIWENWYQDQYAYLANDTKISSIQSYIWDNGAWAAETRTSYTYDVYDNLIVVLEETWDGLNWSNSNRQLLEYDSNHNNFYWVEQYFMNGLWTSNSRKFSEYDNDSDILYTRWEAWYFNKWNIQDIVHYYYSDFVSTDQSEGVNFQVFPNPATSCLTIKGENLAHLIILDQQGRVVSSLNLKGQPMENIKPLHGLAFEVQ